MEAKLSPGVHRPDLCGREPGVKHAGTCLCNFHPHCEKTFHGTDRIWVITGCGVVADAIAVGHSISPAGCHECDHEESPVGEEATHASTP